MGKGKAWAQEECVHLSEAFIAVSEDHGSARIAGTNQTVADFHQRLIEAFRSKKPEDTGEGTCDERTDTAVVNQWKDNIKAQCRKFNKCMNIVHSAKPTGVSQQEKLNMAAAIMCGETRSMQCTCRECDMGNWKFHGCWKLLRAHRGFQPPTDPTDEGSEDDNERSSNSAGVPEGAGAEEATVDRNDSIDSDTATTATGSDNAPTNARKRGGGGRDGTKTKTADAEYKRKKLIIQNNAIAVTRERSAALQQFVENQATMGAFKMAKEAHMIAKSMDDEVEMAFCKGKMNEAMGLPANPHT